MKNKELTPRERSFCRCYVDCGSPSEAAAASGYTGDAAKKGDELLSRKEIADEIIRICELKRQTAGELAGTGYRRLAFGSIADAITLLYKDDVSPEELRRMDLYSVSEIKRKDGSMEIKFFDRFKALEKLCEGIRDESEGAPIYDAILKGAMMLGSLEKEQGGSEA